jgi:hypothetical protein
MRAQTLVAAIVLATAGVAARPASAQEGYRHGRIVLAEPGTTLQRATEVTAEEAFRNLPFLPGDRVWTDSAGRAEFQFPADTVVRLDRRSKLDYAAHEEEPGERIVLRLWSGSAIVHARPAEGSRFEIETPAGMVDPLDRAIVRVDVESGETRLSVYAGEAVLDDGRQRVRLAAGERTFARWGGGVEEPRRFDPGEADELTAWDAQREDEEARGDRSAEYLPEELAPYAGELEQNGTWRYGGVEGYVWVPNVQVGWRPYWNGHWAWTPYGWTWVPYENWGWAPFHYGSWDYGASLGWYWTPGRSWGPAWVNWAVGDGYVGWCPMGRHNRPVVPWGPDRGHAVPRGRYGFSNPWNVVRRGDLGGHDLGRLRISPDRLDPAGFRVADTAAMRPTRDGTALRAGDAVPRAISRRQSPGDFVRELGVDNKTTIPAPWTRGYGPPPAGVEGARYGVPRRTDGREEERQSQDRTAARPASWYTPRATGASSSGGEATARPASPTATERRESRQVGSVYGYRPRSGGEVSGGDRPQSGGDGGSGEYRPRSGESESRSVYRPRSSGSESSGGYRPRGSGAEGSGGYQRSSGGSESSGVYRPRSGGGDGSGGSRPPRTESAAPRPSRSDGGSGGGGHAVSRSPHKRD